MGGLQGPTESPWQVAYGAVGPRSLYASLANMPKLCAQDATSPTAPKDIHRPPTRTPGVRLQEQEPLAGPAGV